MNRFASQYYRFHTALAAIALATCSVTSTLRADDALEKRATWEIFDAQQMSEMMRTSLDKLGLIQGDIDRVTGDFVDLIEQQDSDPMDAYIAQLSVANESVQGLFDLVREDLLGAAKSIDPNTPGYTALEALPKPARMTVRTWLGRKLVRERLYDEALPVIAEVDPTTVIDPAAALFYRGACYHALLMRDEAVTDLRRLLENEDDCPTRFVRTAKMMLADIKPLKKDSLDEISRLMTDVTRRLDLGRSGDKVQEQEQEIIDKLTKLIDKIEKQQQQQQQQQSSGGGGSDSSNGGQSSPMQDSRAGGDIGGRGDVDPKNWDDRDRWGNLPPAERKQALQQISRDLPTHYREAIEAYFRKLATDDG